LKNGQFFGPQIQYDSLGNKLTEKFVLGVDQIPYKYLSDSATDDKFIDVITCHEINYYSNGIMESKGYIVNSLKSGLWTFYHPDGTNKEIIFFKPKALQ
jgi:antitoxin component YwqK of YwqJK toxin-antitoxin module